MNLRDKIWTWAKTLDNWQNDLLRRVYEKRELDELAREQWSYYILVAAKKGLGKVG
jgi:hypothetical protein